MTFGQLFSLVILITVVIVAAIIPLGKNRLRIKRAIMDKINFSSGAEQRKPIVPEQSFGESKLKAMTAEESKAELERIRALIEDRKQTAWDSDISHHLWGLYSSHIRTAKPQSSGRYAKNGEWYEVKILRASTSNGLNEFKFELKGSKYKFVDDEEKRVWSNNLKYFSLFLYDDSDRCIIEIPMKIKVDRCGRKDSISSGGPNAFLPGEWIRDFINVTLKNQSVRNQEIRTAKHQERLSEIEDLKARFGISD